MDDLSSKKYTCLVCDISLNNMLSSQHVITVDRFGHTEFIISFSSPENKQKTNSNQSPDSNTKTKESTSSLPTNLTLKCSDVTLIGDEKLKTKVLLKNRYLLQFDTPEALHDFRHFSQSQFANRTTDTSAEQYFQFYSLLSQQQNMMQDFVRTGTYQQAMLQNAASFNNKIVLDCGAGSSILSFFAIQAGADKVYACEASSIAKYAAKLVENNPYRGRIIVIPGKLEEIVLPEKVDILISEPMGYMLYNERMIESYVHARKFLRNDGLGLMFPSLGDLYCAPFSDEALYLEQHQKASFWAVNSFYGIDLTSLHGDATEEYFSQPIVDQINADTLVCPAVRHRMDYRTCNEEDFDNIEIPFNYTLTTTNLIHGFAFWFDVCFSGNEKDVWLSTSPTEALTHWYQVRCVLKQPLFGRIGEHLTGIIIMKANKKQSYDIDITATVAETGCMSKCTYDLKNPFFRYNGNPPAAVPGTNQESPSNQLFSGVTIQNEQQPTINGDNGVSVPNGKLNGFINHDSTSGHVSIDDSCDQMQNITTFVSSADQ